MSFFNCYYFAAIELAYLKLAEFGFETASLFSGSGHGGHLALRETELLRSGMVVHFNLFITEDIKIIRE